MVRPPAALISSAASCTPWSRLRPIRVPTPLSGPITPILSTWGTGVGVGVPATVGAAVGVGVGVPGLGVAVGVGAIVAVGVAAARVGVGVGLAARAAKEISSTRAAPTSSTLAKTLLIEPPPFDAEMVSQRSLPDLVK